QLRSTIAPYTTLFRSKQNADFVCVQELKAQATDMTPEFLAPAGYRGYFHYAEKKGYSGAGVYCRSEPDNVQIGFNCPEFDAEGRDRKSTRLNSSHVKI